MLRFNGVGVAGCKIGGETWDEIAEPARLDVNAMDSDVSRTCRL